jgi:hypothetical protein
MSISITQLRANIYNIVDDIIKTEQPVEIERDGVKLRIIAIHPEHPVKTKKIERLIARKEIMVGDPEDYVHIDWSDEWKP